MMCTAFSVRENGLYFGRNLDLDRSLGEQILFMPRNCPLQFRQAGTWYHHYAILGMGVQGNGPPLYYDAVNERGLCMAGLNFPGNAVYYPEKKDKENVAPFELIPWVLGKCATAEQARELLEKTNVLDLTFHPSIGHSPLHWLISGPDGSLALETEADGMHLYENKAEVLTNNPPFPYQIFNLNNFRHVSAKTRENTFAPGLDLSVYAQGLGGLGLPGDVSSMSRFVRATFYRQHCNWENPVAQVFHILDSVKMLRGACVTDQETLDETVYSACIDATSGKYYYITYANRRITCVDMHREDMDGTELVCYPLIEEQDILMQN